MSEGATSVAVDLQDLTKRFESHRAVDHLSLQVYEGEILALLAVDAVRTAILNWHGPFAARDVQKRLRRVAWRIQRAQQDQERGRYLRCRGRLPDRRRRSWG